ncbi:hypothetical protein Q1695_010686 [Nippostrongylus brasiliensis]|nr:hypothetical protein Q1695_010686 [Nippostrongylus brasiliensis]
MVAGKTLEGQVHLGDAGLEDEDEDEEVDDEEGDESEGDEVESIEDIKIQNGVFKYRVRWVGCKPSEDTWEPEESFTGSESKALLQQYREAHKDKVEELLKADKAKKGRRPKRGPRWEYVSEIVTRDEGSSLKPRELQEDDVFYGQPAREIAAANSELKKLFDPTHKNSATELFLTKTDPAVKVTRSQTKALIASREASRSNTPIPTKIVTGEDSSRASASPPSSQCAKGPKKKVNVTAKKGTKRKASEVKEEGAMETVVITSSTVAQAASNSSANPPIVLKLTLKKSGMPVRKKRSNSEKLSKQRKKKEKNGSPGVPITPPSPKADEEKEGLKESVDSVEVDQYSAKCEESESVRPSSVEEIEPSASNAQNFEPVEELSQAVKSGGRAVHLLPGPISLNEGLTSHVVNNMLRDLEIKHYGEEERYPYTQEQFNDAILSGNFMRVRKAMVNNVLTSPRLAMWCNPYGANLLHLLCRSTKCDSMHAGDDIATILCSIAPSLLCGRDNLGKIPLHDAVDKGQVCRVTRLLMFHSPVNVTDRNGNSPLSLAYSKNHAKMVKVLLQAGASFHMLEGSERRKSENLRKRRAYDVLTKHSRMLSSILQRTRRKVYRLLTEVRPTSPCLTAPFSDGPDFCFNFYHTPAAHLDGGLYANFLFLHVISMKADGYTWQARCWGGLRLSQAPTLNGRSLEPTSKTDRGDHMIFAISPANGQNSLQIRIGESEMSKRVILAVQVVLVKRAVREGYSSSQNHYPPLEQVPMIGPM